MERRNGPRDNSKRSGLILDGVDGPVLPIHISLLYPFDSQLALRARNLAFWDMCSSPSYFTGWLYRLCDSVSKSSARVSGA